MDKPPRLKEGSEKLVSNEEQESTSNALQTVGDADGATSGTSQLADAHPDIAQPAESPSTLAATVQILRDSAAEREAKKLADQEFLAAYKKHEMFLRIRFGVIVLVLLIGFAVSIPKFFAYIDSEKRVISHVNPAVSAALLGEKDAAYYQTSQLPIPGNQNDNSGLVKNRKKILDKTIAELESGGRIAVFSRLGAEQLLMRANQRESGLKYGDYLIEKYPNLPSNYLLRAEVDLNRGDFAHALSEYDQFFGLIKKSPQGEKEAWLASIRNAIWGCIDYGRVDKAREYLQIYDKLGGETWEDTSESEYLRRSIPIAEFDQLDVDQLRKTPFWNRKLEKYASSLLKEAQLDSDSTSYAYSVIRAQSMGIYTRARDFKSALSALDGAKRFRYMGPRLKYGYATGAAEVSLAMDRPQDAINAIDEYKEEFELSPQLNFLLATALVRTNAAQQAVEAADVGLADTIEFKSPGVYELYHYTNYRLPLLLVKARALVATGKWEQALEICNQVIETSPDMIAPKLLKLEIMQRQNNQLEVSKLKNMITSQLEKVAP